MHQTATSSRRPTGWIISPAADIMLLLATPLAIVPAVMFAARYFSAETIFIAVAAFASIGHHLPGFMRAYGDRELFRRFRWRFLLAPPLVLAAAFLFTANNLHGLELIVVLWATWHIIMQTYGMMRIYDLKRGIRDEWSARLDFIVCIAVFVAGIIFSQTRVYSILESVRRVGLPIGPPSTLFVLQWGLGIAIGVFLAVYAIRVVFQTRAAGPSWAKIALLLITGWLYWSCGSLSTNLLIGVAMFEIFHAIQYNALVWSYNRRLADRVGDRFGPLRFMFVAGWLPLTIYLIAIVGFGSIKLLAEGIDPSVAKTVLLTFLFTSMTLHFYFDGFIWKVSERGTEANLGIASEGRRVRVVPGLAHLAKWGAVAAVAAVLFRVEASGAKRTDEDDRAWTATLAQWTPDVPDFLVRQSLFALSQGRTAEALDSAERAVKARPRSPEAQAALGNSLMHARRFGPAAAALRQAAALAPNVWENHYDLAEALIGSGDLVAANQSALRAVALEPNSAEANYRLGLINVQLCDFPTAENALQKSLISKPNSAPTHLQLGNVYFLTRRPKLAEQSFRRSIELAPKTAEGHGNLGALLLQAGRVAQAKQSLLNAVELNPANAQSHYNLGMVFLIEGDRPAAREQLAHAERLGQAPSPEIRRAAGF